MGNYTEDTDVCEEGAHTYCNSAKDHWKGRKVRAQRVEDYDNYYSIKPDYTVYMEKFTPLIIFTPFALVVIGLI